MESLLNDSVQKRLQLMEVIFDSISEGLMIADENGLIVAVNQGFTEITGYTEEEVLGRNPRILKSDRHTDEFYSHMWESILSRDRWDGQVWNRKKNGEIYLQWLSIRAIRSDESIQNFIGIFYDNVSRSEHYPVRIAQHDILTGLPSRILFEDRLQTAIARAKTSHKTLAVILIDLDQFRLINDALGHSGGDLFLQEIAARIQNTVGHDMTVSRHGGDEFFVLLENRTELNTIAYETQKLMNELSLPVSVMGHRLYITISMGIAVYPYDGSSPEELIRHAEIAMYSAKDTGKNNYNFYKNSMNRRTLQRLSLESDLRSSDFHEALQVYYQPRYCIQEGRICGAEALLRWTENDGLFVNTADFVQFIEEKKLIDSIGRRILKTACFDGKEIYERTGVALDVSVNISPAQIQKTDLIMELRLLIEELNYDPAMLSLEVTESTILENMDYTIHVLEQIRKMGVRISIDDFGSGYSSLNYIKRLPLDTLKIDRSFIVEITEDLRDQAIVSYIISLAHTLHLAVVVEGVESEEQFEYLKRSGADEIQGFYTGRPMTREDLIEVLRKEKKVL